MGCCTPLPSRLANAAAAAATCLPACCPDCRSFEFTTNTGLHVAMAAAAKKGSVLICGASTTEEQWPQAGPVLSKAVRSFRLRSQQALAAL
jgi:hypothetical protein